MTDYKILTLLIFGIFNGVALYIVAFVTYSVIRFDVFRNKMVESIENGDKVAHSQDAANFTRWIQGILCSWFTGNVALVFMYEKMFDVGPMGFLVVFIGVSFTLLGIAWKKQTNGV